MGIQASYRRMSEHELGTLEADPQQALETLLQPPGIAPELMAELMANPQAIQDRAVEIMAAMYNAQADTTRIDLDKDWHAMHYLLTSDTSMEPLHNPDNPLHNIVMGGYPTAIEASYGPARCLSQVEISAIVAALANIAVDELRDKFSADDFNRHGIYPNPRPGGWSEEEVEDLFVLFLKLKAFFEAALEANEVILIFAV